VGSPRALAYSSGLDSMGRRPHFGRCLMADDSMTGALEEGHILKIGILSALASWAFIEGALWIAASERPKKASRVQDKECFPSRTNKYSYTATNRSPIMLSFKEYLQKYPNGHKSKSLSKSLQKILKNRLSEPAKQGPDQGTATSKWNLIRLIAQD